MHNIQQKKMSIQLALRTCDPVLMCRRRLPEPFKGFVLGGHPSHLHRHSAPVLLLPSKLTPSAAKIFPLNPCSSSRCLIKAPLLVVRWIMYWQPIEPPQRHRKLPVGATTLDCGCVAVEESGAELEKILIRVWL